MEIQGPDKLSQDEIIAYRNEFSKGAELFKDALENYDKSTIPRQKEEFKKVMDKTLNVMNETFNVALRKADPKQREKLVEDYKEYTKESTSQGYDRLHSDIESIQQMITEEEKK